jgi:Tfp pilus assembly protein PilZ
MRERGAVRVVPRRAITVVIENQGLPLAYGVVANISANGACVWTNGRFEVGQKVELRLSFPREPETFETSGYVVWEAPAPEEPDALRYGLEWEEAPAPRRGRLTALIDGAS